MLMAVRDVLLDETWNTNELLNELAEAMYTKFQKYWAAPSMVLLIAAVLDPSMKADFVRFFYLTVENTEAEAKMREPRQYLKKYYLEYERVVRNNTGPVFVTYDAEAQFSSQNSSTRSERSKLDIIWMIL